MAFKMTAEEAQKVFESAQKKASSPARPTARESFVRASYELGFRLGRRRRAKGKP